MAESSVALRVVPRSERARGKRPREPCRYHGPVTEPGQAPPRDSSGAQTPGERRLPYPPSDRYRTPEVETPSAERATSTARAVAYAVIAALTGAAATVLLGGVLAVSAGLLVVAGAIGWGVAVAMRVGGGPRFDGDRRVRFALFLASAAVILGQLGLWLFARYEGGVLGPIDYLAETFGLLVPLQLAIAWILAGTTAR
jgi:hypothetical protein